MTIDPLRIPIRQVLLMAVLLPGTLTMSGCGDKEAGARETQFLARRVEKLEEKVNELEARVNRAPLGGGVPIQSFPAATAPGSSGIADAPALLPVSTGSTVADQFGSDEDRARIFLLKVAKLQTVSRPELASVIAELGIPAPELGQIKDQIRGFEEEKGRLLSDPAADPSRISEVSQEIERSKFRLEIAAEGVRSRVVEEGKQISERVETIREGPGAAAGAGSTPAPGSP